MPVAAMIAAPASGPKMREQSDVVPAAPIAVISPSGGMIVATKALRIARSDGRTNPANVAATKIGIGPSKPANVNPVMTAAVRA